MEATRTRFEVLVETVVSPAALATFRVPLTPTPVPRSTVRRLRIAADRDLAEVVQQLTETDVELLEIRLCPEPPREPGPRRAEPGDEVTGACALLQFRPTAGRAGGAACGRRRPRPAGPG